MCIRDSPQYDNLAKELERDNYMELFTLQMLHSRQTIPLKQWLSRYQELTGACLLYTSQQGEPAEAYQGMFQFLRNSQRTNQKP